jgi:hypothetical protein
MSEPFRHALFGEWVSIAPEVRPRRNPDGSLRSFFLERELNYKKRDRFELMIMSFADPFGATPLCKILIKGQLFWRGAHPSAPGAQKVDFHADEAYEVTPLHVAFANGLNHIARNGYDEWRVAGMQSVFGKSFPPFGLEAGKNFVEFELLYLNGGMLFFGARHVDGREFDSEENRPTNLQFPLVRR